MVYTPDQKILLILLILSKEKVWVPGSGSGFILRSLASLQVTALIACIETVFTPRSKVFFASLATVGSEREAALIAFVATALSQDLRFYPA